MDLTNVYIGFALATLAGLSTGIGSMLGLYSKFENKRLLSIKDGKKRQIKQKGTIINKESNADWTIQMKKPYVPFLKFPFKIILIDPDYKYMAVGYPDNKMGWIMNRDTDMDELVYESILVELETFGYSRDQFVKILHN